MDKLEFMRLWDLYQALLTPTQQEITDLYFNLDLTPSEIAEQKGITRQGVSECLKTCKAQLAEFEHKLQFSARLKDITHERMELIGRVEDWEKDFLAANPGFAGEMEELSAVIRGREPVKESARETAGGTREPAQKQTTEPAQKQTTEPAGLQTREPAAKAAAKV